MRTIHNKLVRDRIPEIISNDGHACEVRRLDDRQYIEQLQRKLVEEAHEVLNATGADHILVELADVAEVARSLAEAIGKTQLDIDTTRESLASARGRFLKRLFLLHVDTRSDQ